MAPLVQRLLGWDSECPRAASARHPAASRSTGTLNSCSRTLGQDTTEPGLPAARRQLNMQRFVELLLYTEV